MSFLYHDQVLIDFLHELDDVFHSLFIFWFHTVFCLFDEFYQLFDVAFLRWPKFTEIVDLGQPI